MLSGLRLAMTYMLVAAASRTAWLGFVASIMVRKFGEDIGKVGEGEEVGYAANLEMNNVLMLSSKLTF